MTRPMARLTGILARFVAGSTVAAAVTLLATPAMHAQSGPVKSGGSNSPKKEKSDSSKKKDKDNDSTPKAPKLPDAPLFKTSAIMEATLKFNIKAVKKDKGDEAPWHAATLSYADPSAPGGSRVVPVRVRTRGIWRLKNCEFPPLRLNFANKEVKGTVWHDLDEPKLVSYCKSLNSYEQYVLQEYQLYRVYRLLTPVSHQVRLLKMSYADSASGKIENTKFAFIVEDPASVAVNNGGKILKVTGATSDDLEAEQATLAYLFQYMIGNTDFSFGGLHNAELLALPNGQYMPIAYDFDFAGAIDAPYATPDPSLVITRVRDRQYRGWCQQNSLVPAVAEKFKAKKDAIYALYSDSIGTLINPKTVKETLEYFDSFYATIATQKEIERKILRDCRKP